MEQVPELKVGAMLRINHMVIGVFSVQWFTVVEGGMGDNIRPIDTRNGENMTWGVIELRKWLRERMMGNMRKVITIER